MSRTCPMSSLFRSAGFSRPVPPASAGWCCLLSLLFPLTAADPAAKVAKIQAIPGLVAFMDFNHAVDGVWKSQGGSMPGLPIHLRIIGDTRRYNAADWPHADGPAALRFDDSGPFGRALRCNQGHIYAEIPREAFDGKALDIHGRNSGTLVAWAKFTGKRHFVAGIWDEGGWDKYAGRRQYALFGGLFGTKGVTAHVSTTGAASYPQSKAPGSQYARMRALDGADFANGRWVAMAMTWDATRQEVTAFLDGVATPKVLTDPVAQDALKPAKPVSANPFPFTWPMYGPRIFTLKFNGYGASSGVSEHWLACDLDRKHIAYGRSVVDAALATGAFRVTVDCQREGTSLLSQPLSAAATEGAALTLPTDLALKDGDEVVATLERDGQAVGTTVRRRITQGAPFTIGRALGLGTGKEDIAHGSEVAIDAVAVFDRPLTAEELRGIAFTASH